MIGNRNITQGEVMAAAHSGTRPPTAAVLPFPRAGMPGEDDRGAALQISAVCPGWRAWRGRRDGQWRARRTLGTCHSLTGGRVFVVCAPGPVQLMVAIELQSLLDLAAEYPGWDIGQTGTGRWWAMRAGGPAARRTTLIYAATAVALLSALRGLGSGADPVSAAAGPGPQFPQRPPAQQELTATDT